VSTAGAERAASSLEGQALELLADARRHKRLERHHRRQARQRMAQLEAMRARLARMGVALTIDGEAPLEEERHGHTGHHSTA
jgi:hypothetical protein